MPTKTYDLIATITVSSPTTSINFTSLPQGYRDLAFHCTFKGCSQGYAFGRPNNSTAAIYDRSQMATAGGAPSSYHAVNTTEGIITNIGGQLNNDNGEGILHFTNYSTSKYKQSIFEDATANGTGWVCCVWKSTAAVTSFNWVLSGGGTFGAGTEIRLYGIEA